MKMNFDYKPHWPKFADLSRMSFQGHLMFYGYLVFLVLSFIVCFAAVWFVLHKFAKFFIGPFVYVFYVLAFIVVMMVFQQYVL